VFERFVAEKGSALRGFFRRMGADAAEAEDLAQEVFLKLYRTAASYRSRERFAAFFFRVARNAWIDRKRSGIARGAWDADRSAERLDALESSGEQPSERVEREEQGQRLLRALEDLPEGQRRAFELGVLQGLSYEDVSCALSIPPGTVKSRVFTAIRRMRAALGVGLPGASRAPEAPCTEVPR
jgi:RNA polymerase sigma-70 factor (ECF subfamily)